MSDKSEDVAKKVVFNPKESWQKDDCLFCPRKATLQADYKDATIRCCDNQGCKDKAAETARESGDLMFRD